MRYMLLVYSTQHDAKPEELQAIADGHRAVIDEAHERGLLLACDPLKPTSTATTVRKKDGKPLVSDGPFAETKEHLAGYYILDCQNLDEAVEWAKKIPTGCAGTEGCIEIRPIREMTSPRGPLNHPTTG